MRWQTGQSYQSEIPPLVTTATRHGEWEPSEIKIDFRGLGVYLSTAEAVALADALHQAVRSTTDRTEP